MRISGLTSDGDFRFGHGRALYLTGSEAIEQKVLTRLRSFTDDWFLDVTHGIPWIELLSSRNTADAIRSEISRIVIETVGVARVDSIAVEETRSTRKLTVSLSYTDVFNANIATKFETI